MTIGEGVARVGSWGSGVGDTGVVGEFYILARRERTVSRRCVGVRRWRMQSGRKVKAKKKESVDS